MILFAVTLRNTGDKTLYIKTLSAAVETDQGNQSDTQPLRATTNAISPPILNSGPRPSARSGDEDPTRRSTARDGADLSSVTKEQFDARKDTTVTIEPYDQRPIVLHEKAAAAK